MVLCVLNAWRSYDFLLSPLNAFPSCKPVSDSHIWNFCCSWISDHTRRIAYYQKWMIKGNKLENKDQWLHKHGSFRVKSTHHLLNRFYRIAFLVFKTSPVMLCIYLMSVTPSQKDEGWRWKTFHGILTKSVVLTGKDRKFMVYVEEKNAFIGWRFPCICFLNLKRL